MDNWDERNRGGRQLSYQNIIVSSGLTLPSKAIKYPRIGMLTSPPVQDENEVFRRNGRTRAALESRRLKLENERKGKVMKKRAPKRKQAGPANPGCNPTNVAQGPKDPDSDADGPGMDPGSSTGLGALSNPTLALTGAAY
jgi:hypothetical protein